ncbi:hypothetical protein [Rhodococcoides yunnanense]|uniref:hypothetical protein n=1 Tax=Rhodococcoides yunnanense TaxID=278209 RepID=UPI00093249C2|nr:hypothetical protein [Rhodococcus yunnanensis]
MHQGENVFERGRWPVTIRIDAARAAEQARAKARRTALALAAVAFFAVLVLTACGGHRDASQSASMPFFATAPSDIEAQTGATTALPRPTGTFWERGYCWFNQGNARGIRDLDGGPMALMLIYNGEFPTTAQCPSG